MVAASVIVPLYNKAAYIRRTLDSIVAQTFQNFEVIVVDDGSTDGGGQLAADYPDSRIRVLTQANRGPGSARNWGIDEARGDLLAFLDGDDEWLPEYLADGITRLESYGPAVATFTSGYIEHPAGVSTEAMWRKRGLRDGVFRLGPATPPYLMAQWLAYMSPCSTLARRDVLLKWGGFYAKNRCLFGEDSFLWLKVLLNEQVAFELRPRVCFHREASSLSGNFRGPRPLEPILEDTVAIETACPDELRDVLKRFYTFRAFKTACAWGYWGHWQLARALRDRFRTRRDYLLPYYASSLVCSTPIGAVLGRLWRSVLIR